MKDLIYKFRVIILIVLVCIVSVIITSVIGFVVSYQNKTAMDTLSDINNQISALNTELTNTVYVTKDFKTEYPDGLDMSRKNKDDETILSWIKPAFTFNNSAEYSANRKIFIERLGETDQFLTDIFVPYTAVYSDMYHESASIDDGTNIRSSIKSLETYVIGTNKDGRHRYVAILERQSTTSNGKRYGGNVILTYTIDANGSVSGFRAATPSVTN